MKSSIKLLVVITLAILVLLSVQIFVATNQYIVQENDIDTAPPNQSQENLLTPSRKTYDPGECIPPYFPSKPLDLKELDLCAPSSTISDFFVCNDTSCHECMKNWPWPLYEISDPIKEAVIKNRNQMRVDMLQQLTKRGLRPGDSVVSMTLNKGYYYHWANWACSADANRIEARKFTMITVFDKETKDRVEKAGFMVYLIDWYDGISEKSAHKFGRGPHFRIMVLEHMVRNNLVQMGFNVLFQDVDMIWRKNPLPWLENALEPWDIQVMYDGRHDAVGPANVGFIYARSNCRTKVYLQTMIDNMAFFIWTGSSQLYINSLLHLRKFRQMSVRVLDQHLFLNGHKWWPDNPPKNWNEIDPYVMHASWTDNHIFKIHKWNVTDQWYLRPKCALWEPEIFTHKVCQELHQVVGLEFECLQDPEPE